MGQLGRFDTDTAALTARINAHAAFGARDLNTWVFDHLVAGLGHRVLDLGCGTGKQSLPLTIAVGAEGSVTAVDVAPASLDQLRQACVAAGVIDRVSLVRARLDDVAAYAGPNASYDRVVSCYAIYYADDPAAVFTAVARMLSPGGRFFFCGPAAANNAELKRFQADLSGSVPAAGAAPFMESTGQDLARRLFPSVTVSAFENALRFDSADALYEYWRSYNLYDGSLDEPFRRAAARHFERNGDFTTIKRVIGVLASGRRAG